MMTIPVLQLSSSPVNANFFESEKEVVMDDVRVCWSQVGQVPPGFANTSFDAFDELFLGRGRVLPAALPDRFPTTACVIKDRGAFDDARQVEVAGVSSAVQILRSTGEWASLIVAATVALPVKLRLSGDLELTLVDLAAQRVLRRAPTRARPVLRLVPSERGGSVEVAMDSIVERRLLNATEYAALWHLLEPAPGRERFREWRNQDLSVAVSERPQTKQEIDRVRRSAERAVDDLFDLIHDMVPKLGGRWNPKPALPSFARRHLWGARVLVLPELLDVNRGDRPRSIEEDSPSA